MSSWPLFSQSAFLGLMIAIPVGPVALLIIQRTLSVGPLRGLMSGLGAAVADGLFGLLAALGLAALIEQLEQTRGFVRPLGSLILISVGLFFFFRKPPALEPKEVLSSTYLRHYLWDVVSTFFLTLTNPLTIIAFAAIFAGSDLIPEDPRKIQYVGVAAGIFTGSMSWWMILVLLAHPVKRHLSSQVVHRVFQGVGLVLITLAVVSFVPRFNEVAGKAMKLMEKRRP